ncbi:MAG: FAD-dependent oxidoreductase [Anaerolineae bacterium]
MLKPSYALFQTHARHVIECNRLADLRVQGRAHTIAANGRGLTVETDRGLLHARRVVLAIGRTAVCRPGWAEGIPHVFDADFKRDDQSPWEHAVVIGGGITAAQLVLALARQRPGQVTLLSRRRLRVSEFDASSCWVGPACRKQLARTPDFDARRHIVNQARHSGTVSPVVATAVRQAHERRELIHKVGEVALRQDDTLHLYDGRTLQADRVILATGFSARRPGGRWLSQVIDSLGLPTAACGYPVVDWGLHWGKGIHVSGPLAELELGPAAPNIAGARLAAQRLHGSLS